MPTPNNGWNVVSTTPADNDGWNVVSTQPAQQFGSQDPDQILKQQAGFDPNAPLPSATSRTLSGAWQGVKDAASGLYNTVAHPGQAAAGALMQTIGALGDASQAGKQGDVYRQQNDYVKAIPFFGSMADDAAKHVAAGDYAGPAARIATSTATNEAIPRMVGGALSSTLKGGGKVAQFAAATPESKASSFARLWTSGDTPGATLNKALQPSVSDADFAGDVSTALPAISKSFAKGSGVSGIRDAANTVKQQANTQYGNWLDPNRGVPVDMSNVVDAQNKSIPAVANLENPGLEAKTAEIAARYSPGAPKTVTSPILNQFGKPLTTTVTGKPMTLGDADALRVGNNQKLQGFWDAAGGNKYAAQANPEVARTVAAGDALRDAVYGGLSKATGSPVDQIAANRDLFGAAKNVGDTADTQALKLDKKTPVSPIDIKTGIALAGGHVIPAIGAKALDLFYRSGKNPDALANAAIDRFQSPDAATFDSRSSIPAKAVAATGKAASKAGKVIAAVQPRVNGYGAPILQAASASNMVRRDQFGNPIDAPLQSFWTVPKKK